MDFRLKTQAISLEFRLNRKAYNTSRSLDFLATANFCTLYTPGKEVTIGMGWIDNVCPPGAVGGLSVIVR